MAGAVRAAMRGVRAAVTRLLKEAGTFSLICATGREEVSVGSTDRPSLPTKETTHLVEDHAADALHRDRALKLCGSSRGDKGVGGAVVGSEDDCRRLKGMEGERRRRERKG